MGDELYKIEDVRKNALHFYGVGISLKNEDYYLDFPDEVSAVIPVKRRFGEDGVDTIAKMIKGYKGAKDLKLSDDSLSSIHYNLASNPTEDVGEKVSAGVLVVSLVGFVLFTMVKFNVITGLVVGDVLIDSSGWQVWAGLIVALVAGLYAVSKFRKK